MASPFLEPRVAGWPVLEEPKKASSAAPSAASVPGELLAMHPWAREFTREGSRVQEPPRAGLEDPLAVVVEACSALDREHDTWVRDDASAGGDFFLRMRAPGSSWVSGAAGSEGVVATEANKGLPREWCALYGLRVSATFNIGPLGVSVATDFAVEWCKRMQFFFNIWKLEGDRFYAYTEEYVPDDAWNAFVASLVPGSYAAERVHAVCAIAPTDHVV